VGFDGEGYAGGGAGVSSRPREKKFVSKQTSFSGMKVFGVIWFGQLVSTIGSGLTSFALGLWVYEQTGSVTLYAFNLLALLLPNVLLAPLVGALVDRWDRRRIMILADTGAGVVTLALALLFLSGRLAVWHIYAAIFMSSAFSSFQWPAYSAATTLLVPKKQLARAGGMVQMGQSLSRLLTPAIAGALFATGGLGILILIDFVTFLFAVVTLLLIRIPRPKRSTVDTAVKGSLLREGVYGWTYIKARPGLMGLLLAGASWNLLWGIANAVLVPMILELYSPDVAGYISSVIGAGLLTGTLVMSIWGGPQRLILGALVPLVASGLFAILLGLRPSLTLIAIGSFGVHLAVPLYSASSQAIWQRKVQPDLQGRVFAARRMVLLSMTPIAYLISGPLAEKVFEPLMMEGGALAAILGPVTGVGPGRGAGLQILLMGVLIILTSLTFFSRPHIRNAESEIPDAVEDQE